MSAVQPNNNPGILIDEFIKYATSHLSSVSGIVNTVSLYPPVGTPGPGIVQWSGYQVAPATPSGQQQVEPEQEVNTSDIEMNDAQLAKSLEKSLEGSDINEASAAAFSESVEYESLSESEKLENTERRIELENRVDEDAISQEDPVLSQEDEIKDDIKPVPNYKTKLKVPTELVLAMRKYGVGKTPLERAHFIAQTAHESGDFRYKEEIASGEAYEGRRDLGNIEPGDGKRYKGRGYIQLTGRANYKKFGPTAGADFVGNPTIVGSKYFADTACMFWKANRLGEKCSDSSMNTIKIITKRINGGYNGLDDRTKKFSKYWEELQKDPTLWA